MHDNVKTGLTHYILIISRSHSTHFLIHPCDPLPFGLNNPDILNRNNTNKTTKQEVLLRSLQSFCLFASTTMVHTCTYLCAALLIALSAGDKSSGSVCNLPKVVGRCRAAFRRYYFDSASGHCKLFIYGGCGGNANNFR